MISITMPKEHINTLAQFVWIAIEQVEVDVFEAALELLEDEVKVGVTGAEGLTV